MFVILGGFILPFVGCSEPKKKIGSIKELKKEGSYHEFNGNQVYIFYQNNQFYIVNLTCTHKRCTVVKKTNQWICPCHKGAFSLDGKKIKGRPPRDLYLFNYEIIENDLWIINQYQNP